MLHSFRQDLRYAIRSFAKAPSFTLVVLVTLGLGIGASSAIYSMVDGILIRPLPFQEPDRLVYATEMVQDRIISVSWPNYLDWHARQRSFETLALSRPDVFTMTGGDRPLRVTSRLVTGNFFRALRVAPAIGRSFTDDDDKPGSEAVAVLSDGFWRRQLAGNQAAVGSSIVLDGRPYSIVGVLPRGFRYLTDCDVFVAMGAFAGDEGLLDRGNHENYSALGRLKTGVPLAAAAAELRQIAGDLQREFPNTNTGVTATTELLSARFVSDVRLTLLVLLGAVGFLLLLACVNVANLFVARGAARQHELAIRAALGGSRLRLVMQLILESAVLSLGGAALGIGVGSALVNVLVALAPEGTPRIDEVQLGAPGLLVALGAAVVCGVVFGAFPAFQASGVRGQHALVRSRTAGASARSHRLRRGLMVVEVALALVLLTGAGLMVRTLRQLTAVDTGIVPDHVITMRLALEGESWTRERRTAFCDDLLPRIRSIPGVAAAALTNALPIDGSNWNSIFIVGDKPVPARAELPSSAFTPVSDGYFQTMRMRLIGGRFITAGDRPGGRPVVVVNETLARRLWPGENAVGKRLKQGWPETLSPWRDVVGVVNDVKFEGVSERTPMQVYLPLAQEISRNLAVVVRSAGAAEALPGPIEHAVHAISKDVPVFKIRTMDQILDTSVARERMAVLVLGIFAIVALIVASVGLYGVVAHGVTERTHEIGVRMALGADSRRVLGLIVGQGLSTALVGALIGVAGAFALARAMRGLLFGVTESDPTTFVAVVALLLMVSALACYLPARRATRVDPTTALRAE